jgi:hypothetical protein
VGTLFCSYSSVLFLFYFCNDDNFSKKTFGSKRGMKGREELVMLEVGIETEEKLSVKMKKKQTSSEQFSTKASMSKQR